MQEVQFVTLREDASRYERVGAGKRVRLTQSGDGGCNGEIGVFTEDRNRNRQRLNLRSHPSHPPKTLRETVAGLVASARGANRSLGSAPSAISDRTSSFSRKGLPPLA